MGIRKDSPVHVYVQEGGSSGELYLHAFNTRKQAEAGRRSCDRGAYNTTEIIEIPRSLADHPDFQDVVDKILAAAASFD